MQLLGNEYEGNSKRVSLSPPMNKIPTTMIGFNNLPNGSGMQNSYGLSNSQSLIQTAVNNQGNYSN